jgi:hypothetical protein
LGLELRPADPAISVLIFTFRIYLHVKMSVAALKKQELQAKRRSIALLLKQPRVGLLKGFFETFQEQQQDEEPRLTRRSALTREIEPASLESHAENQPNGHLDGVRDALAALEGPSSPRTTGTEGRPRTDSSLSNSSIDSALSSSDTEIDMSEPEMDGESNEFALYSAGTYQA